MGWWGGLQAEPGPALGQHDLLLARQPALSRSPPPPPSPPWPPDALPDVPGGGVPTTPQTLLPPPPSPSGPGWAAPPAPAPTRSWGRCLGPRPDCASLAPRLCLPYCPPPFSSSTAQADSRTLVCPSPLPTHLGPHVLHVQPHMNPFQASIWRPSLSLGFHAHPKSSRPPASPPRGPQAPLTQRARC